jgi:hypothetical protein
MHNILELQVQWDCLGATRLYTARRLFKVPSLRESTHMELPACAGIDRLDIKSCRDMFDITRHVVVHMHHVS